MALLSILQFPDPRLKLVAKPVEVFDQEMLQLYENMLETMYSFDGIGLAATQVNIQKRIIVMDLSLNRSQPLCLINPKIINAEGEITWEEGCLSFPGVFAKVTRSAQVKIEYFNQNGEIQTIDAQDLNAVCIQHEIDHLNGITFFDHLSPLKQKMIRKKLEKTRDRAS